MDDNSIYTLTNSADSIIDSGVETMDAWLLSLDEEELTSYYKICNKKPEQRTGQDEYEICRHSVVLYCRELGLTELGLTSEFMKKITGSFCINVILETFRRKGLVEISGPILLYKKNEIKLIKDYKPSED